HETQSRENPEQQIAFDHSGKTGPKILAGLPERLGADVFPGVGKSPEPECFEDTGEGQPQARECKWQRRAKTKKGAYQNESTMEARFVSEHFVINQIQSAK